MHNIIIIALNLFCIDSCTDRCANRVSYKSESCGILQKVSPV